MSSELESLLLIKEHLDDLIKAEKDSLKKSEIRASFGPGSTRARITTANARWAIAAEHRDRMRDRLFKTIQEELGPDV